MSNTLNYNKFKIMWKDDVINEVTINDLTAMEPPKFNKRTWTEINEIKITRDPNHVKYVFDERFDHVSRKDLMDFGRRQIMDEHNALVGENLSDLGLSDFDVWEIFKRTRGISDRNRFWIQFEGESLNYETDIKNRKVIHGKRTTHIYEHESKLDSIASKGAQPKWRSGSERLYVKRDYLGQESLAERVVYLILDQCSNIRKERLVPYYTEFTDRGNVCYSRDFKVDEDEFSLTDLLEIHNETYERLGWNRSYSEKLESLKEFLVKHTNNNFDYELKLMFAVDAFFLNEDRHLSNVAFLQNDEGEFKLAPIFDNGLALLARSEAYSKDVSLSVHMNKVKPVLLSSKFKKHVELYDYDPFLYKDKLQDFLEEHQGSLGRMYFILKRQMGKPHLQKLFIPE